MNVRRPIATAVALSIISALAVPAAASAADPIRDSQWHLRFLNITAVHKITKGAGVTVAVIDSGVDATHPDLKGSVLAGRDFAIGSGDGRRDLDGHGTKMAGLIAAHGRALGMAPSAKILPIRANVGTLPIGTPLAESVDWAVDHDASVLCIALAGEAQSEAEAAIKRALAADVVVVAGVGNLPEMTTVQFPAAYPGVVAAAGIDKGGNHARVSVTGPQVVLAAPAVDIVSTSLSHDYRSGTGTSDATAIIAGAAALVRAKYPDLSAAEVVHRLTATADDKGPQGRDDEYGYGVLNIVKALTADVPPLEPSSTTTVAAPTSTPNREKPVGALNPVMVLAIGAFVVLAVAAGIVLIVVSRRR